MPSLMALFQATCLRDFMLIRKSCSLLYDTPHRLPSALAPALENQPLIDLPAVELILPYPLEKHYRTSAL